MIQHFKFENLLMLSIGNCKRVGNITTSFKDCLS